MADTRPGRPAGLTATTVTDTDGMIGGLAKLLLLRVLPRRLIPLLTAWEIFRVVRALQRPKQPEVEATSPDLEATTPELDATMRRRGVRRPPPR